MVGKYRFYPTLLSFRIVVVVVRIVHILISEISRRVSGEMTDEAIKQFALNYEIATIAILIFKFGIWLSG